MGSVSPAEYFWLIGLGVAVPGIVDNSGKVVVTPNLELSGTDLIFCKDPCVGYEPCPDTASSALLTIRPNVGAAATVLFTSIALR